MRVLFFGTPEFAVPSLRALGEAGHRVVGVVTQPDRPRRRSSRPVPPPVKELAIRMGVPVLQPDSVRTPEFLQAVQGCGADVLVVVAYGKIFPPPLLEAARLGSVNLHGSLLPRWRGPAPIQWSIASGDRATGVCTMRMDEGCDTGPVLLRRETRIGEDETAVELSARLAAMGADLMVETLAGLEGGGLAGRPQDGRDATRAPMLRSEDGAADWSLSARALYDRWRGFQPWPGLYTELAGRRLALQRVRPLDPVLPPGVGPDGELWLPAAGRIAVRCGSGTHLELLEVRPEGRRTLTALDAVNGRLLGAGMRCGPPGPASAP